MVQRVNYHQFSGNTVTLGAGGSRVVMGADSGNLKIQDSQSNTSVIEAGLGIQGSGGATIISNASNLALPPSGIDDGSLYFSTNNNTLYAKIGNGWYKVTTVNTSPSISLSATTANIDASNLTLDFTYTVTEPEGTPVTVSLANSGIATVGNVAITHTTSNNHVRAVFDGTTELTGATITLTVTDGVNTGAGTMTMNATYAQPIQFLASGNSWSQDWTSSDPWIATSTGFTATGIINASNDGGELYDSEPLPNENKYFEIDYRGSNRSSSSVAGGELSEYMFQGMIGGYGSAWGYLEAGAFGVLQRDGRIYEGTSNVGEVSGFLKYTNLDLTSNYSAYNDHVLHWAYNPTSRKVWLGISRPGYESNRIRWCTYSSKGGAPSTNVYNLGGSTSTTGAGFSIGGSSGDPIKYYWANGASGGSVNRGYFRTGSNIVGTVPSGFTVIDG